MTSPTVLLTHGYFLYNDPKEIKIMKPYPPLGILYVSAYFDMHNIENEVFDTTFSSKEKLKARLLENPPPYLALYINLMTKLNVLEIIKFVKEHPKLKHIKTIVGGPDVRYNTENLLKHGADYLVIGEGEVTALELVQALESGELETLYEVQGLAFLDEKGEVVQTAERTKVRNINELPYPNRHKIDMSLYLKVWKEYHGKSTMSVSTMRGCPYTCKWCSRGVYGLSYRRRSPEQVVQELIHIRDTYNPDSLWFVDDVFTVNHRWLHKFRDELKKQNVHIPFECITRADRMNEEIVGVLKDAGCFRVWIGAESGSQKIIDLMDRRVDVNKVRDMIKLSKAKGIQAGTFIMLGYPGETEADIDETIHHLKSSNPDYFTITVAYPIRGTDLFQEIESIQTTDLDWELSTDRQIDFKRMYSRRYYDFAVRHVFNSVYSHKRSLEKQHFAAFNHKIRAKAARLGMWWERTKGSLAKS